MHINSSDKYTYRNVVSDEEDEDFLDDDPGLDIVYKEKLGVSLLHFTFRLMHNKDKLEIFSTESKLDMFIRLSRFFRSLDIYYSQHSRKNV